MSFDYFSIPDGTGPLADIFSGLTFDMIAKYVVTWLYYIFHSTAFSYVLYIGMFILAVYVVLSLINAFNARRETID